MKILKSSILAATALLAIAGSSVYAADKPVKFQCKDKKSFEVVITKDQAKLTIDKKTVALPAKKSASGQYSDGKTTLSVKGKEASIEVGGKKTYEACKSS